MLILYIRCVKDVYKQPQAYLMSQQCLVLKPSSSGAVLQIALLLLEMGDFSWQDHQLRK